MAKQAMLLQGNQACAFGALAAGVRFFAGYPITPSTEIAEILAQELPKVNGRFIQMEDEIASMGAVLGASLANVKAITATSGPGFSLKQELIGYASMAQIPSVIINVQRVGPSTGMATSPAQGDVMQARWGTHGDHTIIALSPASVLECYTLMIDAVNMAEKYRTPVIFLMDEVIGHMREDVRLPEDKELTIVNRKVITNSDQLPYKSEADGVAPMSIFGEGHYFHVTGLSHDETGFPQNGGDVVKANIDWLNEKIDRNLDDIIRYEAIDCQDADYIIIAYGGTSRSALQAKILLEKQNIRCGFLCLKTIWPFPYEAVKTICQHAKMVVFPEMNCGQLVGEVRKILPDKVVPFNRYDGQLMLPEEIAAVVENAVKEGK